MKKFIYILTFIILAIPNSVYSQSWTEVRDLVRSTDKLTDKKKVEENYRKAYTMAQAAVKNTPKESDAWLWLANSAGRLAQVVGSKEKIELSKVVKDNAEKAIALDTRNGAAYMTLGAWHFYVADLSWLQKQGAKLLYGGLPPATYQDAIKNLLKAMELGAENPVEIYYLIAKSYQELDNDKEALSYFKKCANTGTPRNEKEKGFQKEAKNNID